jgi:hypothetical protein
VSQLGTQLIKPNASIIVIKSLLLVFMGGYFSEYKANFKRSQIQFIIINNIEMLCEQF